MSQNNIMFKTAAFGGFDKRAVLNYIMQMNKTAEETQQQMGEQLRLLGESRQQLDRNLQESQALGQKLQEELTAEREKTAEMAAQVEQLTQELQQQHTLLTRRDGETQMQVASKEEELAGLQSQCAALLERNTQLEAKVQEIDQATLQIGKMMVEARTEAEQVLGRARQETQGVVEEAKREAQEILVQARRQADQIEAKARIHSETILEESRAKADTFELRANQALEQACCRFAEFRQDISGLQTAVWEMVQAMQERIQEVNSVMDTLQYSVETGEPAAEESPSGQTEAGPAEETESQDFFA